MFTIRIKALLKILIIILILIMFLIHIIWLSKILIKLNKWFIRRTETFYNLVIIVKIHTAMVLRFCSFSIPNIFDLSWLSIIYKLYLLCIKIAYFDYTFSVNRKVYLWAILNLMRLLTYLTFLFYQFYISV